MPSPSFEKGSARGVPAPNSGAAETHAALAGKTLHVHDPRQRHRVAAVLRFELEGAVRAARDRLLELVRERRLDVRAHHLAALEADLDPNALVLNHSPPAPRGLRARSPDGRTRPRARRALDAAPRRSARRLAQRGREAPPARRR